MDMTAAVSIKLPTFWQNSPSAWFIQAEAQFALRNISADDTHYYYVVSALDTETANRALSVISTPPADNKYLTLKKFLLSAYEKTEEERAAALFSLSGLGDRKPSELMDHMLALLGHHKPCFLFQHIFLTQLPEQVRAPLANSPNKNNPRALALEADQLVIASRSVHSSSVHVVNHDPTRLPTAPDVCFFHKKFGKHARKCNPPCKFYKRPNNNVNQGNGSPGQQ